MCRTSHGIGALVFSLKCSRTGEHVRLRRRRRRSSPPKDVSVERRSVIKHIFHISHLRCVPTPNVVVERRSGTKHRSHMSHFLCVPLRNVAVEITFIAKALISTSSPSTHIFHQTHVPIRHRTVIVTRRPPRALASYRSLV